MMGSTSIVPVGEVVNFCMFRDFIRDRLRVKAEITSKHAPNTRSPWGRKIWRIAHPIPAAIEAYYKFFYG